MSSEVLEKPPWVKTLPGQHPSFAPLSKEEAEKLALEAIEEAKRLGAGQGAQFLTADQKFILDAERRREHHKKNAELFAKTWDKVEELKHRVWWAEAAIDLGKFDEVKEAIKGKKAFLLTFSRILSWDLPDDVRAYISKLVEGLKHLPKIAAGIRAACKKSDSKECNCEREEVETDKGTTIALDRRFSSRRVFSSAHNQIVTVWQCRHCGFVNATAAPPKRQANYDAGRKQVETTSRIARAKGEAIPKGVSDAQILKVIENGNSAH